MKPIILLCCFILTVTTGCESIPVREISYHGQLPPSINVNYSLAVEFANDLAAEAGLKVSYVDKRTGIHHRDETIHVFFSCPEGITASMTFDQPEHLLYLIVNGNIDSPVAKMIADKTVNLFQKKFPDGKIFPFTRYQSIMGP
jgi:hypothetical protein